MNEDIMEDQHIDYFRNLVIEADNSHEEKVKSTSGKYVRGHPPKAPSLPPSLSLHLHQMDFEVYVRQRYENKIKLLQRSTFPKIPRPIILAFNHYREFWHYHRDELDTLYQLSLVYEKRIEFIVGDLLDIDLIYPDTNPLDFFCYFVHPEKENIKIFAINEGELIYEHFDVENTVDTLRELCENLLSGRLYKSQAIPVAGKTLVRICVHLNFEKSILESSKDILLIVGIGDYLPFSANEPSYEELAMEFQESNLEFVYIDGDKNYVNFKYGVGCYPTLLFIPHNDKTNFVPYEVAETLKIYEIL